MTSTPERPHAAQVTELFEEYLAQRERQGQAQVEELLARAGDASELLRERIHVYGLLHELGDLIAGEGAEPKDAPTPEKMGRFEIVRPIGEGGLSRVFLAWDSVLERELAIKVMRPASALSGREMWIVSEGKKLARLEHESIVRVLDVGEYDERAYVAMEYVPGPTLAEVLEVMRHPEAPEAGSEEDSVDARRSLAEEAARSLSSTGERTNFVLKIARALAYCHEQGIVHRDIKPGNVLIDAAGTPKLIDFGLAKLDSDESLDVTDRLIGTPAYLAPEQVDNERTGASTTSDQFSLGTLMYELLTLKNPFVRDGRSATLTAISRATVPALRDWNRDIPEDLERICLHCLEKSPQHRYGDIQQFVDDLEAFLAHRAISIQAPSLPQQLRLFARRHRDKLRLGAAGLLAVATVSVALIALRARAEREEIKADVNGAREVFRDARTPDDFVAGFQAIHLARSPAQTLDTSLLGGLFWAPLDPQLDEAWKQGASALGMSLSSIYYDAGEPQDVYNYAGLLKRYESAGYEWKEAIDSLLRSANGLEHDIPYIPIGSIAPWGSGHLQYYMTETLPGVPFLVDVRPGVTLPGMYRYTERAGATIRQTEFWIASWTPQHRVAPLPLAEGLRERLVHVEGGVHRFPELAAFDHFGAVPSMEVEVDPFFVSSPVTWREVFEVFPPSAEDVISQSIERRRGDIGPLDESAPANLPWSEAQEYARRVGARIPTPLELWQALQQQKISPPTVLNSKGDTYSREWVTTKLLFDDRYAVTYAELRRDPPAPQAWGSTSVYNDLNPDTRVCFRVAISE